jgi:hypothetical protein
MCDLVAEDESMNKPLAMFGTLTLSAVAFVRAASRSSSETQIYAGEMFGDRVETSISGSPPRLRESTTFGGRYTYEFMTCGAISCPPATVSSYVQAMNTAETTSGGSVRF